MDEALVSADGPGFQGRLCNCEPVSHPFPEADAPEGGIRSLTAGLRPFRRRHEAFGLYPRLRRLCCAPGHRAPSPAPPTSCWDSRSRSSEDFLSGGSFGTTGCAPPLDVAYSSSLAVPAAPARRAGPGPLGRPRPRLRH